MLSELIDEDVLKNPSAVLWTPEPREDATDWRTVDCALREIRRKRSGLDAEEMHWLRQAEALKIWRHFGMVSMLDISNASSSARRARHRTGCVWRVRSAACRS